MYFQPFRSGPNLSNSIFFKIAIGGAGPTLDPNSGGELGYEKING